MYFLPSVITGGKKKYDWQMAILAKWLNCITQKFNYRVSQIAFFYITLCVCVCINRGTQIGYNDLKEGKILHFFFNDERNPVG